jgi:hypothetical protein
MVAILLTTVSACGGNGGHAGTTTTVPAAEQTTTAPVAHILNGQLALGGFGQVNPDVTVCFGYDGYSDIVDGTPVVVKDGNGSIIGTSQLGPGTFTHSTESECVFTFTVTDLPDVPFYSIEISHRGAQAFSREQLDSMNWTVAFTLGGP